MKIYTNKSFKKWARKVKCFNRAKVGAGQKRPNGPSLKLLNLVADKGLEVLTWFLRQVDKNPTNLFQSAAFSPL